MSHFFVVPVSPEDKMFFKECIAIVKRRMLDLNPLKEDLPDIDCDRYYGLPSNTISIYSTRDPWLKHMPREAQPITIHPIASIWHKLGWQIYKYFDSVDLKWTTINPVCFAEVSTREPGPLCLWVGVMPGTLTHKDAMNAAIQCSNCLPFSRSLELRLHSRNQSSPSLLDHSSLTTLLGTTPGIPLLWSGMTQLLIYRFHLLPYLASKLLQRPSPTLEALVVFIFAKVEKTNRFFSLQPKYLTLKVARLCNIYGKLSVIKWFQQPLPKKFIFVFFSGI